MGEPPYLKNPLNEGNVRTAVSLSVSDVPCAVGLYSRHAWYK